jgi:uncharacterized protein
VKGSRFNIFVPAVDGRDTVLLNTLYGSISTFDDAESRIAQSLLSGGAADGQMSALYDLLVAQKHLVADNLDEIAIVEQRKRAGVHDRNTLEVIVLPTLDCNFSCVYCYENHQKSRMSSETVSALKLWLSSVIPNYKVVMLYWFGGEPLLQLNTLISVSRHVKSVTDECGALAVLHITTNGYLLDSGRAKELAAAGVRDYQITVDGPAMTHDKMRVLRNGRPTFARVFHNICTLAATDAEIKITLRINFNHTNIDYIPNLLGSFPVAIRRQLRVVFEPIFGDSSQSAVCNITAATVSEKLARFCEQAATLGYDIVFGVSAVHPGKLVYCYAERENQFIINFDGNVFKCSVCEFDTAQCVGRLRSDGSLERNEREWAKWVNDDLFASRCYSCVYLPLCMGGCRKTRMEAERGAECALIATNASYVLKQIAFGGLQQAFRISRSCDEKSNI